MILFVINKKLVKGATVMHNNLMQLGEIKYYILFQFQSYVDKIFSMFIYNKLSKSQKATFFIKPFTKINVLGLSDTRDKEIQFEMEN